MKKHPFSIPNTYCHDCYRVLLCSAKNGKVKGRCTKCGATYVYTIVPDTQWELEQQIIRVGGIEKMPMEDHEG